MNSHVEAFWARDRRARWIIDAQSSLRSAEDDPYFEVVDRDLVAVIYPRTALRFIVERPPYPRLATFALRMDLSARHRVDLPDGGSIWSAALLSNVGALRVIGLSDSLDLPKRWRLPGEIGLRRMFDSME